MPQWPDFDLENLSVAAGTLLATVLSVLGIQKRTGGKTPTTHDKSRSDIRILQDRCKDLEHEVKNLKEKVAAQAQEIMDAERKQEVFATLVFNKLDSIGKTLVKIQVAVGVAED